MQEKAPFAPPPSHVAKVHAAAAAAWWTLLLASAFQALLLLKLRRWPIALAALWRTLGARKRKKNRPGTT